MSIIAKPYTFSPNTTASSSQVNSNFDTLYNDYNGGISAANLAADAVTTAKIADANVTTAKLADGSVTASKLDADAIGHGFLEIARTTLSGAGDTISVTSIPARRYLKVIVSARDTGGTIGFLARFNNDSGATYARRYSVNGAADTTETSQTSALVGSVAVAGPMTSEIIIDNFATDEKTLLFHAGSASTAGAGNAPSRVEGSGKWTNTTDQITRIDIINNGTGDFTIGSEVIVFGHD